MSTAEYSVAAGIGVYDGYSDRLLSPDELLPGIDAPDPSDMLAAMMAQQLGPEGCPTLQRNVGQLGDLQYGQLDLEGGRSSVILQHNPMRKWSATVNTAVSKQDDPCVLCPEKLLEGERGIAYGDRTVIFGNPYPSMPGHIVLLSRDHEPQTFDTLVSTALDAARDFAGTHFILYNGPKAGASSPLHAHLQGGSRDVFPIEADIRRIEADHPELVMDLERGDGLESFTTTALHRTVVTLRSRDKDAMIEGLQAQMEQFGVPSGEIEPKVNVLMRYDHGWSSYMFPRDRYRPSAFDDHEQPLHITPATLEMAGLIIVPHHEQFERITAADVTNIFREVSLSPDDYLTNPRQDAA